MFPGIFRGALLSLLFVMPAMANGTDTTAGKKLFLSDCSSCHRENGSGGVHFGDAVSADLRAPGLEQTYKHSDKLLLRAILQAKDEGGEPLDAPMPAWQGRLTAAEAMDIIAYLKTLKS